MCVREKLKLLPLEGPDYNYDWYDVPGTQQQTELQIYAMVYHVEITDLNGCLDTSEVIIVEPATEVSIDVTDSSIKCNNVCEGEAFAVCRRYGCFDS